MEDLLDLTVPATKSNDQPNLLDANVLSSLYSQVFVCCVLRAALARGVSLSLHARVVLGKCGNVVSSVRWVTLT